MTRRKGYTVVYSRNPGPCYSESFDRFEEARQRIEDLRQLGYSAVLVH